MLDPNWMKMHGYNEEVNPIIIDDQIREIIQYVKRNLYYTSYTNQNSLLKNMMMTKKFLCENFKLHPVKVMKDEKLLKKFDGKYADGFFTAIAMNREIPDVNPLRIPRQYHDRDVFNSCLEENILICDDPVFITEAPIVFESINLSRRIPDVTGCLYAHEVMHTQLNSRKGAVQDFNNSELISIFTELLTAYNNDRSGKLLDYMIYSRFANLYLSLNVIDNIQNNVNCIDNKNLLLDNSRYVVSFLKALDLFDLYLSCGIKGRKNILKRIQKVIDGKITLEDQLEYLDISYDDNKGIGLVKKYI